MTHNKIVLNIQHLVPNAKFTLTGTTYKGLQWLDERPKPTLEEIAAVSDEEVELAQWRKTATLSRRKFMLGIKFYSHGEQTLEQSINGLLETLEEPTKTIVKTSLDQSTHFDRLDQDLITISQALELTPEQVDNFFKWAEEEKWRE